MRTFLVPALPGENMVAYQTRISSMSWQFVGTRELSMLEIGAVSLDGDKPVGSTFVEVIPEEAP